MRIGQTFPVTFILHYKNFMTFNIVTIQLVKLFCLQLLVYKLHITATYVVLYIWFQLNEDGSMGEMWFGGGYISAPPPSTPHPPQPHRSTPNPSSTEDENLVLRVGVCVLGRYFDKVCVLNSFPMKHSQVISVFENVSEVQYIISFICNYKYFASYVIVNSVPPTGHPDWREKGQKSNLQAHKIWVSSYCYLRI